MLSCSIPRLENLVFSHLQSVLLKSLIIAFRALLYFKQASYTDGVWEVAMAGSSVHYFNILPTTSLSVGPQIILDL